MARTTVDSQLSKLRKQMLELQAKEKQLLSRANDKVLTQIVSLAKKHGVSAEEISAAMGKRTTPKAKVSRTTKKVTFERAKVAPKYRNPTNAEETWTGRGKSPKWVATLKESGLLDTALIVNA